MINKKWPQKFSLFLISGLFLYPYLNVHSADEQDSGAPLSSVNPAAGKKQISTSQGEKAPVFSAKSLAPALVESQSWAVPKPSAGQSFSKGWKDGLPEDFVKKIDSMQGSSSKKFATNKIELQGFSLFDSKAIKAGSDEARTNAGQNPTGLIIEGSGETAATDLGKAIIGPDDRREISELRYWREMRFGQIIVGDLEGLCSGALVSPRHVLTAAHCVVDQLNGEFTRKAIYFAPGRTEEKDPLGYFYVRRVFVTKQYRAFVRDHGHEGATRLEQMLDLAVLELDQAVNSSDIGSFSIAEGPEYARLKTTGYPGDKPLFSRWTVSCDSVAPDGLMGFLYENECDSMGGQSGSAMIYKHDDGSGRGTEDYVVGVLSGGTPTRSSQVRLKHGNILLWSNFDSVDGFDWWSAGNMDFVTSWINWDNLADLLNNDLGEKQKSQIIAKIKDLTSVRSMARSGRKTLVQVVNMCNKTISDLAFGTIIDSRENVDGFFHDIYPETDVKLLTESTSNFLLWAQTESGNEWSGSHSRTLHGYDIEMIRVGIRGSEYDFASPYTRDTQFITCN